MITILVPCKNLKKDLVHIEGKTLSSMFLIMLFLLVSTNKSDVATASPTTYVYVDPSVVRGVTPTNSFNINISVAGAPQIYAWEIFIEWNPSVLNVTSVKEGDFLHRWDIDPFTGEKIPKYTTTLLYSPPEEPNPERKLKVLCTLLGDEPWASGDGWLLTLGLTVKAQGSSVLELYKTSLFDRMEAGAPAPTYYPNNDGFFYNIAFHNIAVTNITASQIKAEADEPVDFNVTVANEGNYSETFDVAVYADITTYNPLNPDDVLVGDEITVGTQTGTTLDEGATKTLSFTWNTTGVAEGSYTISAKSLLSDDDTRDNIFINGTVKLSPPAVHDIAITNVIPSSTEVTIGENVTIKVTVKNEGSFNETFYVTVYYDNIVIANQTNVALTNGTSTTLTFTWGTKGVSEGTYTISAKAPPVNGEREVDTTDNTFTDGTVKIRGATAPNILIYALAGIVIIMIAAAVVIYILRFRK